MLLCCFSELEHLLKCLKSLPWFLTFTTLTVLKMVLCPINGSIRLKLLRQVNSPLIVPCSKRGPLPWLFHQADCSLYMTYPSPTPLIIQFSHLFMKYRYAPGTSFSPFQSYQRVYCLLLLTYVVRSLKCLVREID